MQVKRLSITVFSVLFSLLLPSFVYAQRNRPKVVSIPDPNLAAAIRQEIGNSVTTHTLLNLTRLEVSGRGIKDLTGLQHAHNLRYLDLQRNAISDISPLSELTQLTVLLLGLNNISDVSPLADLKQLTHLSLADNHISDISPLADLKQLTYLNLDSNHILDVSPLADLKQLTSLGLSRNYISDVSPLSELKKLTRLQLWDNNISDIFPLAELKKLTRLALWKNNILDISPVAELKNLTSLTINDNHIWDISPLAELKQLTELDLASNNLSDISALAELKQLTELDIFGNNISDISALAELKNLTSLTISNNYIWDISPLAELKQLTRLQIRYNNISDISPLAELKQLTRLDIGYNNISDISPLAELRNLTALNITGNPLSYASINTHIPTIQAKGIEMDFDERVPRHLVKISYPMEQGMVNSPFPLRFVVEVQDQRRQPFSGVPVTFSITAGDGRLTAADRRTDATGKATARLKLGRTVGSTTVRVTAAHISESVAFTAVAVLRSKPVYVPDANLRAKIAETLRIPPGETLTVADMLKLRRFTANDADIRDLTGLQLASNLTFLSLANNSISDTAPLAGLPRLTTLVLDDNRISNVVPLARLSQLTLLSLRNNWISDVSPLVGLTQLKGSQNRYGLDLRGNRLTSASIHRYIPLLQVAGVNVGFENTLTDPKEPMVRLIYFFPRDRQPQPDINAKIDGLIKASQKFYADEMERHGFGRKTFRFETDASGNAVVHHIKGQFSDRDYIGRSAFAGAEVEAIFHTGKNTFIVVRDFSQNTLPGCGFQSGITKAGVHRGIVSMPASGHCFRVSTMAHELGHAFGLDHDFRNDAYIMSHAGVYRHALSKCAAEWLDVHRYFNTNRATFKWTEPTIEMLPPNLISPSNTIRLRFKLTSPNGLHQIQLRKNLGENHGLTACQNLNGKTKATVDFVITSLKPRNSWMVMVADVHGILGFLSFSVDIASLFPPPQPVSIPDPNLAAAIRQEIGDSITTHTLLNLTYLDVRNSGITNLTGLEHAHSLITLSLSGEKISSSVSDRNVVNTNRVSDFAPLAGLVNLARLSLSYSNISDVSPLANLKNLTGLSLSYSNISDVSPLASLTRLTELHLDYNNISDISSLASLKNLTKLHLQGNTISDISPLANLKKLTHLHLEGNDISDVTPLANLKNLTALYLSGNNISDVSPLAGLTKLTELWLNNNNISDVSPLAKLKNLTELDLMSNNISDVSPLVALDPPETELGTPRLFLPGNPLSDASINMHIPALRAKGFWVQSSFDDDVQFSADDRPSDQSLDQTLEKITGPWLWMIAPTDRNQGGAPSIDVDSLAAVSRGIVTETDVAANGANEGDRVGNFVWTPGQISPTEGDINECLNRIGMTTGDVNDHSAYALFSLPSDADRTGVRMSVGSDDVVKVWLNGAVVHKNAVNRPASDFQDTFQVDLKKGENLLLVKVSERAGAWRMFVGIDRVENTQNSDITADVNGDGVVNIQDLVSVASHLGHAGQNVADVNGDGVVNIQDLVLVAGELGGAAAAPFAWHAASTELPSRDRVEQWLAAAYRVPRTDARLQRGIDWLERLLAAFPPKETALLTNYPNPFNPETWIPYQLSEPAAVTVRIYSVKGGLVRTLVLGHQPAGMYHRKSRAAYWDGRNAQGEKVASGLYFYTLSAGDFTATRKMLIRK